MPTIKTKIHLPVLQKKQAAGESDHVMDDKGELVSSSTHTCSDTWWTAAPLPMKVKNPWPILKKQAAAKSDFFTDDEGELASSGLHICTDTHLTLGAIWMSTKSKLSLTVFMELVDLR